MLKTMFFLSIVALSGPRKVIKFDFVGQMPILTERSYSVTLKTLFFKNIQLDYCTVSKLNFLRQRSTNVNRSKFTTVIFIH